MGEELLSKLRNDFGFENDTGNECDDCSRFFSDEYIGATCEKIGFSQDIKAAFLESIPLWEELPELAQIWRQCHHYLFSSDIDDETKRTTVREWPDIPQELNEKALMFYAFLFLSGTDYLFKKHGGRNIPIEATLDTLRDMGIWICDCHQKNGRWGLTNKGWISNQFFGTFFQLGRLQFNREKFPFDYQVFRHKTTTQVVVFVGGNELFRDDGQFNGTSGVEDPDPWESSFELTDQAIRGTVFSPYGKALRDPVCLSRADWRCILKKDDDMLGIHIPASGAMSHELCGNSIRKAMAFFPRHFPDFKFKTFNCVSWFLDNQFAELLPEKSNIYQFLKEVYLYPVKGANDSQVFSRVFGKYYSKETIDQAPYDNSLRRLIVDHVKDGNHWHTGGCLLFPEDFNWGAEVYRKMPFPA